MNVIGLKTQVQVIRIFLRRLLASRDHVLDRFWVRRVAVPRQVRRQKVEIRPGFAAVKRCLLWRVNEHAQTVLELIGRRKVNETVVASVKTADESGNAPGRSSQTEIDSSVHFHAEIRITDDELKGGSVRAPREKFFRRRRPLRIGEIERQLPVAREIPDGTGSGANRPELLVLLAGRRQ